MLVRKQIMQIKTVPSLVHISDLMWTEKREITPMTIRPPGHDNKPGICKKQTSVKAVRDAQMDVPFQV